MKIHLIAVGTKMPSWIEEGYREYARRLPSECALQLLEIPLAKRGKGADTRRLKQQEGKRILESIPRGARVVALEVDGRPWSTEQLSGRLERWMGDGCDIAVLVGGPDGLDSSCRERADELWSLSSLTLPHPLVRIVVAEQIYRAWTILKGHPYHRS